MSAETDPFPITPALDDAISTALSAWYAFGARHGSAAGADAQQAAAKDAQFALRQAIVAALVEHRGCGATGCRWIARLEGRAEDGA